MMTVIGVTGSRLLFNRQSLAPAAQRPQARIQRRGRLDTSRERIQEFYMLLCVCLIPEGGGAYCVLILLVHSSLGPMGKFRAIPEE